MEGEPFSDSEQFYIAASHRTVEATTALTLDDTFAVFSPSGDMDGRDSRPHGLYHRDTRHLATLTVRVGGLPPLPLAHHTSPDGVFIADLTNPDLWKRGALIIPRGLLHLERSRLVMPDGAHERIRVASYAAETVSCDVVYEFAADFADIFEVRGRHRSQRGRQLPAHVDTQSVELSYRGLDDILRRTRLAWNPPPAALTDRSVTFQLRIGPRDIVTLSLVVDCRDDDSRRTARDFDGALSSVRERNRKRQGAYAAVDTSDGRFNEWLSRSSADLRMITTETPHGQYPYAGVPWFNTAFGRDGIITALAVLWLNPALSQGVLRYLAATQADAVTIECEAEPGKILHETRCGEMAAVGEVPFGRYFGSVDSTPLFVILAGEYLRRTADLPFVASIWPNVCRALSWIEHHGDLDGDGFVEYERRASRGLSHHGWKDSSDSVFHVDGTLAEPPIALCEVQGYVYAALRAAETMARALGDAARATAFSSRAASLRTAFDRAFWLDDLGTYALALDRHKKPCCVRSSNPGHCLFTGIAEPRRAPRIAETLMSEEMFSGWGLRTVGLREARYNPMSYHNGSVWPHDTAIAAAGFARYGQTQAVTRLLAALYDACLHFDQQRLPELFCGFGRRFQEPPTLYPVACAPQAWAAASIFMLLQSALGLSIDAAARRVSVWNACLPEFLDRVRILDLRIGSDGSADLVFERHARGVAVTVLRRDGLVEVVTKTSNGAETSLSERGE